MGFSYKSSISFGLVFIPVRLHAVVRSNDIGFNMLEKSTMSRIRYKKTCEDCDGREVAQGDIVRAYQYEKDRYVVITDEELESIKTKRDKTIAIEKFVDISEIDPIYYDRAFYVEPTGAARAFKLLVTAMEKQGKAGIARSVLGSKESLIAVRVVEGKMLVSTMFFDEEIQRLSFEPAAQPPEPKELELAETIIASMQGKFDPTAYEDEYKARLSKALEAKIAGEEIKPPKTPKDPTVATLMEALQKSLLSLPTTEKQGEKQGKKQGVNQGAGEGKKQGEKAPSKTPSKAPSKSKASKQIAEKGDSKSKLSAKTK